MNPWEKPGLSIRERVEAVAEHHEQKHRDRTGTYGECPGYDGYGLAVDMEAALTAAVEQERRRILAITDDYHFCTDVLEIRRRITGEEETR